ncbi:LysR substrate-binding domain-containing protein [Marinobacter zhejiangensis]|uniref:DNA-binding transcriptional regulator, LysR family n=1 Tax=Marinobacter zhejiangensis TaxID=488535 RepID=A0A1I4Q5L9_9GAMM|nr:LysR substrate-binding domain-containing protein [Marinobacter zhejiangensis]SFM35136.1 DNA-binding transcriptional regulator, LysR family [Marinobacter zhejiangensis]
MKLNLRSVDLNLLPVFAAVVEHRQLSRAAEHLGMSQPAVSAALQRLRLTVGDALFVRSRSGLQPTPRADALYQQVRQGLEVLTEALDPEPVFDPATAQRNFRIVAVDYLETLVLGKLVSAIQVESQSLGVKVLPQQAGWQKWLLDAEADFAFDTQPPDDARLLVEAVGEEALVVVARQGHPLIKGSLSLDQFLMAGHVVLPERERRTLPLDQILGMPGWRRNIGAQVGNFTSLVSVASTSDLIATIPLRLADRLAPMFQLQVLPFPVPVDPVPVYLIWPSAMDQDPAHRWLKQKLLDCLPYG